MYIYIVKSQWINVVLLLPPPSGPCVFLWRLTKDNKNYTNISEVTVTVSEVCF